MSDLMTISELAQRLRVPEATIRRWRLRSEGPQGFKVGRRVMYRVETVERWLDEREAAERRQTPAAAAAESVGG